MKFSIIKGDLFHNCFDLFQKVISDKSGARDIYKSISIEIIEKDIIFEGFALYGGLRVVNKNAQKIVDSGVKINVPFEALSGVTKTLDRKDLITIESNASGFHVTATRTKTFDKVLMETTLA